MQWTESCWSTHLLLAIGCFFLLFYYFLIDVFLVFRIEPDACHSIVIRMQGHKRGGKKGRKRREGRKAGRKKGREKEREE